MKRQQQEIIAMHTLEKKDLVCSFILKDGFVHGVAWSDEYHFHSFFEIHYVLCGELHIMIDDREYHLDSGSVCVIPPGLSHYVYESGGSHRIGFRFSFKQLKKSEDQGFFARFQKAFGNLQGACFLQGDPLFDHCVNASREALAGNAPAYVVDELLFLAIDRLAELLPAGKRTAEPDFEQLSDSLITEYIEDHLNCHYQSTPKLEDLSQVLRLSPRQLQREIKRLFGMTFSELLTAKRLMAARFLLKTTAASVEEIAHQVGFCDRSYFCRRFSACYGITPTQYRQGEQKSYGENP